MRRVGQLLLGVAVAAIIGVSSAGAAPVWQLQPDASTFVTAGSTLQYSVTGLNVGDAPTSSDYQVTAMLPAGLTAVAQTPTSTGSFHFWTCTGNGPGPAPGVAGASVVRCTTFLGINPPPDTTLSLGFSAAVDPGASGALTTRFEIAGGGATQPGGLPCGQAPLFAAPACASASKTTTITNTPAFGVDAFDGQVTGDPSGTPFTQAGGHPYEASTQIDFNTTSKPAFGNLFPVEPTKDIVVDLPPGFVGNPTGIAQCTMEQIAYTPSTTVHGPLCPAESQVGVATVRAPFGGLTAAPAVINAEVYNMVPPPGVAARFAMNVLGVIVTLDGEVRSGGDYGLSIDAHDVSEGLGVFGTTFTFWGTPSDPSHNARRRCPGAPLAGCISTAPAKPFLRLPTSCPPVGVGAVTGVGADSWTHPGVFKQASFESHLPLGYPLDPHDWGSPQGSTSCERLRFDPTLSVTPPAPQATGRPAGFAFDVDMSQADDPNTGAGPADIRKVVSRLPEGVRLSPSAAGGLTGCLPAQIALDSTGDASCPDASKIGSLTINTPLLADPLSGAIYLATPHNNPSNTLIALYLVAKGPGVIVKLAGKAVLDPVSGQITATFDNNPQLPFEHLHLQFKNGPRAALVTPSKCGTYTTHTVMTSWAGTTAVSDSDFTVSRDGHGAPCPPVAFHPRFVAGVGSTIAGKHTSFDLLLSRDDDEQELNGLSVNMPRGLVATLKGLPLCPAAQAAAGTCGEGSRIGSVSAGAGPGPTPFFVPGRVYMTGAYKDAPFGLSIVVPVVAGPFDLGTLVVRAAVYVNRKTTALRIVSDPLPTILEGVPLQARSIHVTVDRPGFILNPTSCKTSQVRGTVTSTAGTQALVSSRFQVGNCSDLGFAPRMRLRVGGKGHTRPGGSTPLRTTLTMGRHQSNLSSVSVTLPDVLNARLPVVENACTQAQFASGNCEKSRAGTAVAHTPLLDKPLRGGVYFVKDPAKPKGSLPDLIVALRGQVDVDLVGTVTIPGGRVLATTFKSVPDVPIDSFTLSLVAGRKGPVGVIDNLCSAKARRANVTLDYHAQTGRTFHEHQPLDITGCTKHRKGHK